MNSSCHFIIGNQTLTFGLDNVTKKVKKIHFEVVLEKRKFYLIYAQCRVIMINSDYNRYLSGLSMSKE